MKFSSATRQTVDINKESPGPGQYSPKFPQLSSPKRSFTKDPRSERHRSKSPGPAEYGDGDHHGHGPSWNIGGNSERRLDYSASASASMYSPTSWGSGSGTGFGSRGKISRRYHSETQAIRSKQKKGLQRSKSLGWLKRGSGHPPPPSGTSLSKTYSPRKGAPNVLPMDDDDEEEESSDFVMSGVIHSGDSEHTPSEHGDEKLELPPADEAGQHPEPQAPLVDQQEEQKPCNQPYGDEPSSQPERKPASPAEKPKAAPAVPSQKQKEPERKQAPAAVVAGQPPQQKQVPAKPPKAEPKPEEPRAAAAAAVEEKPKLDVAQEGQKEEKAPKDPPPAEEEKAKPAVVAAAPAPTLAVPEEQKAPLTPDGEKPLDDYVDDIVEGRGGIYEKRMKLEVGEDYTAVYRSKKKKTPQDSPPASPSPSPQQGGHTAPTPSASVQPVDAGHAAREVQPAKDTKDRDVEDYVDGLLTGRGGIYEQRMGVAVGEDYTQSYRPQGECAAAPGYGVSLGELPHAEPEQRHDPKDRDVEDYVDGLLTGRGGIYEKRMGVGIDEDYTQSYRRRPGQGRSCDSSQEDGDTSLENSPGGQNGGHPSKDKDIEDYADGILTGRGGIYEQRMGVGIDEDYTQGFRARQGDSDSQGGSPGQQRRRRRSEHDPDVADYVDGLVSGRGGLYEQRMGCNLGDDWAAEYMQGGERDGQQGAVQRRLDMSDDDSDLEDSFEAAGGCPEALGGCSTHRRCADDIRIVVKIRGEDLSKAFYLNIETSFKGLISAVSQKLGAVAALCYRDGDLDMDVEVDDDESLSLFLEIGGTYKLTGLRTAPERSTEAQMRAQLLWGNHECHEGFAKSTKALPPVDMRAAPYTARAPPLASLSVDRSYRERLLDDRDRDFERASRGSLWKQRSRSERDLRQIGSMASRSSATSALAFKSARALGAVGQRRPDGHIPPRPGTFGSQSSALGSYMNSYSHPNTFGTPTLATSYPEQHEHPAEHQLDTNFSIPQAFSVVDDTEPDTQPETVVNF